MGALCLAQGSGDCPHGPGPLRQHARRRTAADAAGGALRVPSLSGFSGVHRAGQAARHDPHRGRQDREPARPQRQRRFRREAGSWRHPRDRVLRPDVPDRAWRAGSVPARAQHPEGPAAAGAPPAAGRVRCGTAAVGLAPAASHRARAAIPGRCPDPLAVGRCRPARRHRRHAGHERQRVRCPAERCPQPCGPGLRRAAGPVADDGLRGRPGKRGRADFQCGHQPVALTGGSPCALPRKHRRAAHRGRTGSAARCRP